MLKGTSPGTPRTPFCYISASDVAFGNQNATKMEPDCFANARKTPPKKKHESLRTRTPNKPDAVIIPCLFCWCSLHVFRSFGFTLRFAFTCRTLGEISVIQLAIGIPLAPRASAKEFLICSMTFCKYWSCRRASPPASVCSPGVPGPVPPARLFGILEPR